MMKNTGKKAVFSAEEIGKASEYVKELDFASKAVGGLVVLMMRELKLTGNRIAALLRVSGSSIDRVVSRFRAGRLSVARRGGGRNHFHMTPDEEKEFLASFRDEAQGGGIVTVDVFARALEKRLGCEVRKDYVYKLLKRNGWRKVQPDKSHPKNDVAKMEEFKKKLCLARYCWVPPSRT